MVETSVLDVGELDALLRDVADDASLDDGEMELDDGDGDGDVDDVDMSDDETEVDDGEDVVVLPPVLRFALFCRLEKTPSGN